MGQCKNKSNVVIQRIDLTAHFVIGVMNPCLFDPFIPVWAEKIADNFNLKGLHRFDMNDYLFTFIFLFDVINVVDYFP